ncbi:MAG: WD40 repeat domain-containing protein, partial [Egibacteraceae bacterium]
DQTVRLWDVASHEPVGQPLTGHIGWVWSVGFSPDGKLLASGGEDQTVRLWDVASRQPVGQPLTGHIGWVRSVGFSPDGKLLASASVDGTVRLWAAPSTWIDEACQLAGRNLTQDEWDELIGADHPYVRQCATFSSGPGAPADAPVARYPAPLG